MELSGFWPVFGCAAFGGFLLELLKWWELRESPARPTYAGSPFYWGITIAMILVSGGLGVLYGTSPRNAIMVLNIGISAPLLIKALAELRVRPPSAESLLPETGGPARPQAPGFHRDTLPPTGPSRLSHNGLLSFLAWR